MYFNSLPPSTHKLIIKKNQNQWIHKSLWLQCNLVIRRTGVRNCLLINKDIHCIALVIRNFPYTQQISCALLITLCDSNTLLLQATTAAPGGHGAVVTVTLTDLHAWVRAASTGRPFLSASLSDSTRACEYTDYSIKLYLALLHLLMHFKHDTITALLTF